MRRWKKNVLKDANEKQCSDVFLQIEAKHMLKHPSYKPTSVRGMDKKHL